MTVDQDITLNVVDAIEMEETIKQKRISANIPRWLAKPFKEFAGVKGSKIHEDLNNGSLVYHRFVMRKKAN